MCSIGVSRVVAIAIVQKDKPAAQVHGVLCHSTPASPRHGSLAWSVYAFTVKLLWCVCVGVVTDRMHLCLSWEVD